MSGGRFELDTIRALAAILADTGLTEIEVADAEGRIRLVRAPATVAAPAAVTAAPPPVLAPAVPAPPEDDVDHPGAVLSPMVGVVYLAPEPGAPPFVAVGQSVAAGQTLLLIEAMKTFNQIKAPRSGTLSRVLVSSGAPVEYGEVLMILEP